MADDARWERYAAAAGIAFVVLILLSGFLPGVPPASDDPVSDIHVFYADHRTALLLATYLGGLATIFSLVGSPCTRFSASTKICAAL